MLVLSNEGHIIRTSVTFAVHVDVVDDLPETVFAENLLGDSDPVEDGDGAPTLPDIGRLFKKETTILDGTRTKHQAFSRHRSIS